MSTFSFRFAALLLVLCCGLGKAVVAQAPPAAPPSPPAAPAAPPAAPPAALPVAQNLSVLVVDVQSLLQNSKAAKMVRSQIEQKRNEYSKEISREEEALRAERDTLQRQQASMSPEVLNKRGREFQQKVNNLDLDVQSKRQALEKSNTDALSKIQSAMLRIIADIAKRRKANLVLQRTDLVLFDRSFDVTDEVLQKLDEELPVLNVNFVAPVPPSASEGAPPNSPPPATARAPTVKGKRR